MKVASVSVSELVVASKPIDGGFSSSVIVTVCVLVPKSAVPEVTVISITIVSSSKSAEEIQTKVKKLGL